MQTGSKDAPEYRSAKMSLNGCNNTLHSLVRATGACPPARRNDCHKLLALKAITAHELSCEQRGPRICKHHAQC